MLFLNFQEYLLGEGIYGADSQVFPASLGCQLSRGWSELFFDIFIEDTEIFRLTWTGPGSQNTNTRPTSPLESRSTQVKAETDKKKVFPSDTFFHVEGTVVYREYSTDVGDPYYPVPNKRNKDLYAKYQVCVEWQNWQMWPCDYVTCSFSSTRVSFQHNLLLNKMAKNAVRQSDVYMMMVK